MLSLLNRWRVGPLTTQCTIGELLRRWALPEERQVRCLLISRVSHTYIFVVCLILLSLFDKPIIFQVLADREWCVGSYAYFLFVFFCERTANHYRTRLCTVCMYAAHARNAAQRGAQTASVRIASLRFASFDVVTHRRF